MGNVEGPRLLRIDLPEVQEFAIQEGTTRIGRAAANEIILDESAVSRFHCYLVRQGGEVRVFNGESKNAVRVDGKVAEGQPLQRGQVLKIGRCRLRYQGPALPRSPKAVPAAVRVSAAARVARGRRRVDLVLVGFLLLVPAALLTFTFVTWKRQGSSAPDGAGPAGSGKPEDVLLAQLADLRRQQEEYGKQLLAESDRKLTELNRRIAQLQSELDEARRKEFMTPPPPSDPASTQLPAASASPATNPEAPPSPPSAGAQTESALKTVAVKERPQPVKRDQREIGAMVERLRRKLDDYATDLVRPQSLEPDLGDLSRTHGKYAAEGLVDVYQHARQLQKQTEASIEENRRRKTALVREAEAAEARRPKDSPGSKSDMKGKKYDEPSGGPQLEKSQRLLELSEKAAQIHEEHLKHLLPLKEAILAALGNMADAEALEYLRYHFLNDPDEELSRALLPVFESVGGRESIPTLFRRLSLAREAKLKEAVRASLVRLAGVDLGDQSGRWAEWWTKSSTRPPGAQPGAQPDAGPPKSE